MSLNEIMKEIESHEFSAYLNVASDFKTLLRIAEKQEAVLDLLDELDFYEARQIILTRIIALSRIEIDPRYENPWDIPLTIYIWLLSLKDFDLANAAAEILAHLHQSWWAMRISRYILLREHEINMAGYMEHRIPITSNKLQLETDNLDTGEAMFTANLFLNITEPKSLEIKNTHQERDNDIVCEWFPKKPTDLNIFSQTNDSSEISMAV